MGGMLPPHRSNVTPQLQPKNFTAEFLLFVLAIACLSLLGCGRSDSLPVYTMDQTDSSHHGYRRTTLTSGSTVYVNDYQEYTLQLMIIGTSNVVGHVGSGEGQGNLDEVIGQNASNYVFIDEGMYPDGVYRNIKTPPFDWRTAKFQWMRFARPDGPAAQKTTTDPALMAEVLTTLRDDKIVTLSSSVNSTNANVYSLLLTTDQLPGMFFGPFVYMDKTGPIYLTYNIFVPEWHAAGPLLSAWVQTR